MNLKTETIEAITSNGRTPDQIIFIGSAESGHQCTWEEFLTLADRDYDAGYGSAEVATDLIIVFSDGSNLWRTEYDGAESWVFSEPFRQPKERHPIRNLFAYNGYDDLADINPPLEAVSVNIPGSDFVGTRIFTKGGKINFVDTNNVLCGFDIQQDCCEEADWFISDTIQHTTEPTQKMEFLIQPSDVIVAELHGFTFDQGFFQKVDGDFIDAGGMVIFRLENKSGQVKYLHLYNAHNGWYGHGFTFQVGETMKHEECL